MTEQKILAERFEANRAHLRSVAYRMLGSQNEADDAVQETFLRLIRADTTGVGNLAGWLTTIVARVCLDILRARRSRREVPVDIEAESLAAAYDIESETLIADSIAVAMLVVLETLSPAERVAFVLHDLFNVAFDDIAPVVGRSPLAARQLASRARRRVQSAPAAADADRARRREVVSAFLAASQEGDFSALLAIMDPDVLLRADARAVEASVARAGPNVPTLAPEIRGRDSVANIFRGRAKAAQRALVDGEPGLVIALGSRLRLVFEFEFENGRIVEINLTGDPERIASLEVEL